MTELKQIYRVYIKAEPQAVWDAITSPEWTDRYGYGGTYEPAELAAGAPFRIMPGVAMRAAGVTDPIVDGEVVQADPPTRLVLTWRMLMDPQLTAEGFTRVSYDLAPGDAGVTRLTVIHELDGAPGLAAMVDGGQEESGAGGGWSWILSDLKSLLETGARLAG